MLTSLGSMVARVDQAHWREELLIELSTRLLGWRWCAWA